MNIFLRVGAFPLETDTGLQSLEEQRVLNFTFSFGFRHDSCTQNGTLLVLISVSYAMDDSCTQNGTLLALNLFKIDTLAKKVSLVLDSVTYILKGW